MKIMSVRGRCARIARRVLQAALWVAASRLSS